MKLQMNHNSAKERIIELVSSGNKILDSINTEYFDLKHAREPVRGDDVQRWEQWWSNWHMDCLIALKNIFPTDLEAIRFKNKQPSLGVREGNVKWNVITNNLRAKLETLDQVIGSLKEYTSETTDVVYIESIDSFAKARDINPQEIKDLLPLDILEDDLQRNFEDIIGENFHKKDWGGEINDLATSQIKIGGERVRAAFLLKGRGTPGKLTISKCGKNGDQIERLVESPADIYVIQHVGEIDERVINDLKGKIQLKRSKGETCRMCIIDGTDTARILKAYGKI